MKRNMIHKIFKIQLLFWSVLIGFVITSCNKSNTSTPLPTMMDFMISQNWRLDTVLMYNDAGIDTITMENVAGFSTSSIRFYNREDSSFVFKDILYPSLTGPDGVDSLFRYTYGKWSMNDFQDSVYLYSEDTLTAAKGYSAAWAVSKNDSTNTLYADYVDTITTNTQPTYLKKRIVFVKNTFY